MTGGGTLSPWNERRTLKTWIRRYRFIRLSGAFEEGLRVAHARDRKSEVRGRLEGRRDAICQDRQPLT